MGEGMTARQGDGSTSFRPECRVIARPSLKREMDVTDSLVRRSANMGASEWPGDKDPRIENTLAVVPPGRSDRATRVDLPGIVKAVGAGALAGMMVVGTSVYFQHLHGWEPWR